MTAPRATGVVRRPGKLLLLAGLLIIGLLIAAITADRILRDRTRTMVQAEHDLGRLALILADQADRAFAAADLAQSLFVEMAIAEGVHTPEAFRVLMSSRVVNTELTADQRALPQLDSIGLADADGNLINLASHWPVPAHSIAPHAFFEALKNYHDLSTFVSQPFVDSVSHVSTIVIARKVSNAEGDFLGISFAGVQIGYFEQMYQAAYRDGGTRISLFGRDGTVLARYPRDDGTPRRGSVPGYLRRIAADGGVLRHVTPDGQDRLVAGHALAHYPMVAAISSPVAEILATWRRQSAYQTAGAVTLEMVLACAALLIRRYLHGHDLLAQARAANTEAEARLAIARERARANQELSIQNVRFVTAMDSMVQALCLFDAAGGLIMANARMVEIYGLDPAALTLGSTVGAFLDQMEIKSNLHQSDIDAMRQTMEVLPTARTPDSRIRHLADGRTLAINLVKVKGDGWLLTIEDITDRKAAAAKIAHMAHHDALTELPNRVRLLDKLGEAIARSRRGERFALLYLDLDHFKAVNDTLGHPVGDALLRQVSQRLRAQMRDTETVARLGGDEFALVQSIEEPGDAAVLADRLIETIRQPYDLEGNKVTIGTSVGIALIPDDGEDADTLMKNADMALYSAKGDGRGRRHFFEPRMDARMRERRLLELDLRQALAEGEFQVYYQPLMNLKTGMVTGFEALVRWHHPERGMVSPTEFIPLAEEIGLIVPLGNWVLRQACLDAANWPGAMKVAVNVSVVQFGSHTLVEDVAAALQASGRPASQLELEITETVMLDDTDSILVILHQLRDLGVGIAMDDFGTGYSSLSYLRRFPFSKVKIDRSFIEGLGTGGDCDAIVTAVTELCETLGMSTLAEGVENEAQLTQLRSGNCGEAQGYLFSPPRPASEVAAMCLRLTQSERVGAPA